MVRYRCSSNFHLSLDEISFRLSTILQRQVFKDSSCIRFPAENDHVTVSQSAPFILIRQGNDFNISPISIYGRVEGHFLDRKFLVRWFEARDRISFRTANTVCRLCVRKAYALTRFRSPHNPCIIAVDLDRPVPSKLFSNADYKMSIAIIDLIYSLWESWRSDKLTGWENWKAFLSSYNK